MGTEILLLVCFAGLVMPYKFSEKRKAIIDTVEVNDGVEKPCLNALMKNHRLMYLKLQTVPQRIEILELKHKAKQVSNSMTIKARILQGFQS